MALIEIESLCFKKKEGQDIRDEEEEEEEEMMLGTPSLVRTKYIHQGVRRDGWMDGWMKDYLAR